MMIKQVHDMSDQRRGTMLLIGGAVLLAGVLGFIFDRVLELAA